MNQSHLAFLARPAWSEQLRREVLPWIDAAGDLGDDVLEIGLGPGLSTDLRPQRVTNVTAVEIDRSLAVALQERLAHTNVNGLCGDGADKGLGRNRFPAATAFSFCITCPLQTSKIGS